MNNKPMTSTYRDQIVATLAPVQPLLPPAKRAWVLMPLGILLAASGPLMSGGRGDLQDYAPLLTWAAAILQSMLGLWVLALGFREAVPGQNVSTTALAAVAFLTAMMVVSVTLLTNAASPTVVPVGREWRDWIECVVWPATLGAPFMIAATLMASRAFPTRPAIAGGLCGLSAGVLSDAGWRMSCWISDPLHVVESHGVAVIGLAAAGSVLAVLADSGRWSRLRR